MKRLDTYERKWKDLLLSVAFGGIWVRGTEHMCTTIFCEKEAICTPAHRGGCLSRVAFIRQTRFSFVLHA